MSTGWAKFGSTVPVNDSTFSETLGGNFLKKGIYKNMIIASIEPYKSKSNKDMIKMRYETEDEAGVNNFVLLEGSPDDKGNPRFHFAYIKLGLALCGNEDLRLAFFGKHLPKKPEDFKALTGMRLSVEMKDGTTGYEIKDVETGGKQLFDVETGKQFPDTDTYTDFTEAKEAAKELGIYPCYPELDRIFKAEEEFKLENEKVIQEILDGSTKPKNKAKKKAKTEVINMDEVTNFDDIEL